MAKPDSRAGAGGVGGALLPRLGPGHEKHDKSKDEGGATGAYGRAGGHSRAGAGAGGGV